MKLSVITTIYNAAPYLEKSLDSVFDQTFKDFELILVNDGSTDESRDIMLKYTHLPNVRMLENTHNEGIPTSRNRALLVATGEYIAIHDGDDISFPERFQKEVDHLDEHKDIDFLGSYAIKINHNGDIEVCKKMIDMAVSCGSHAVKFQKRTVDLVYSKEELSRLRETPYGSTNEDLKRHLEFGKKEYDIIDKYCKEKGIMWFASPWDVESVKFLEKYDVPCYKLASACITNKALVDEIKKTGKPIIMSTGMSTMEEVEKVVEYIGEENLVLLHCT